MTTPGMSTVTTTTTMGPYVPAKTKSSASSTTKKAIIGGCVGGGVLVLIIAVVAMKYSSHSKSRGTKAYDALDNDLTTNMAGFSATQINDQPDRLYEDDVELP